MTDTRAGVRSVSARQMGWFGVGGILHHQGRFAGILVGEYTDGALRCRGFVGAGLRGSALVDLLARADGLVRPSSPFADVRWHRNAIWVKPGLLAEVTFREAIHGWLRDPVFSRLIAETHVAHSRAS